MIEAKGGRAKLNSIETFFTFGEYVWRNFLVSHRLQTRGFDRFPDFSWHWYDNGTAMFGIEISHCYYDRGYCLSVSGTSLNPQPKRRAIDPEYPPFQEITALLLETRWRKPVLGGCSVQAGDTTIEASFDDAPYLFHLPNGASLPDRVDVTEPRGTSTHILSGYEPFDGVTLPTRYKYVYGRLPSVILKMKYEINPDYDRSLPNREPSQSEGPDSWRNPKTKPGRRR